MTNDEFPNDERMSNDEVTKHDQRAPFRHWTFDILSSFVLGHSSFSQDSGHYFVRSHSQGQAMAGLAGGLRRGTISRRNKGAGAASMLLEFTVLGPPVSHQTHDRANLKAWKDTVRREAARHWTGPPLIGRVKLVLMNFYEGPRAPLDDDNMAKPIRDALIGLVYEDDSQISHAEHSQTSIDGFFRIRGVSKVILAAFHTGEEFIYVRIEDAPHHTELPK
jgi:crossover junction endodeoxyribonuclease RusA